MTDPSAPPSHTGRLFIIGGGRRPPEMMRAFLTLVGTVNGAVAIVPFASSRPEEQGSALQKEQRRRRRSMPGASSSREATRGFW